MLDLGPGGARLDELRMSKSFVDVLRDARTLVSNASNASNAPVIDPAETAVARKLIQNLDEAIARFEGTGPAVDRISVLCHDLKDPLASVVMGAGFLRKTVAAQDDGVRRVINAISRAADQLGQLISDFHDLSKLENGRLSVSARPCDVTADLAAGIDGLASRAAERKVELVFEAPVGPAVAVCDPARMLQAVTNLVANAIRFTEAGGRVVIRVQSDEKWVRVVVSDTGRGIPADRLPTIFDPAANASRVSRDGPGLGLPIVKGLVELLHGRVTATSKEGEGSSFEVALPRVP